MLYISVSFIYVIITVTIISQTIKHHQLGFAEYCINVKPSQTYAVKWMYVCTNILSILHTGSPCITRLQQHPV